MNNWRTVNKILNINNFEDKLYKLANILPFSTKADFYNNVISFWINSNPILNTSNNDVVFNQDLVYLRDREGVAKINDFVEQMQFLDINNYLLDDILTKVDRASMHYGLEAREPLLDHRVE